MAERIARNMPERTELTARALTTSKLWQHDDGMVTYEFPLVTVPSMAWCRIFNEVRDQQEGLSEARLELDGPTVCVRSRHVDRSFSIAAARVHVALTNLRVAQAVVSTDPQCRQGWRGPLPSAVATG